MSQFDICYELWEGDAYRGQIDQWEWDRICEAGRGLHWVEWLPGFGP